MARGSSREQLTWEPLNPSLVSGSGWHRIRSQKREAGETGGSQTGRSWQVEQLAYLAGWLQGQNRWLSLHRNPRSVGWAVRYFGIRDDTTALIKKKYNMRVVHGV